jgi:cell filamentation protein, protein adenylyltransferase
MVVDQVDREYLRTHAHITFRIDLSHPNPVLWTLLGEAKSKSEHVARSLLRPETSRELLQVFLTKGALSTTAIEGNTLSEEEARRVIEHNLKLPPSKQYLAIEVQNVIAAYNVVKAELMDNPRRPLTARDILEYNRLILDGLEEHLEDHVIPGQFRDYSVTVGGGVYRAAPPRDLEFLVDRLCDWLNSDEFDPPAGQRELAAPYAIIKAIIAHLYLAWIHPFGDGNGRTARLLELWVLLQAGFPAPVTQLLSNHYNATRTDYYRQLNRASQTGEVAPFLVYAARGFVDNLREQLDSIWRQQFADRWEQYVYEVFGEGKTVSAHRRLRLVLDLSKEPGPVPRAQLRRLTPELAEMYAGKTDKTLTRDLNELRRLDLIRKIRDGYVPQNQRILGFMTPEMNEDGVLDVRVDLYPAPGVPAPEIRVPIEATPEDLPAEA